MEKAVLGRGEDGGGGVYGYARDPLSSQKNKFPDPVERYVDSLKRLTYVTQVNIFSRELVQIYSDTESLMQVRASEE